MSVPPPRGEATVAPAANAVNGEQGGGIVNPLDGITGYDLIVTGLAWANADGSSVLKHGDKVQFTMQIKNDSNVDNPEGVTIPVKVQLMIQHHLSIQNSNQDLRQELQRQLLLQVYGQLLRADIQ